MTFASAEFLIFFAIIWLLLLLVQRVLPFREQTKQSVCHILLLIGSYVFYGWWDARFTLLLLGVTVISFFTAGKKDENHRKRNRIRLFIGVAAPLVVLGLFKYFDFFVDSFCQALKIQNSVALHFILPVGISFYTFQALSYTIDVYNGKLEKETSFIRFALYISFFPQLVAGPIVKASEFLPQLREKRFLSLKQLESGIQIFVFGMFKKVVLADNLSVFVDEVFRTPQIFHWRTVLLAVISYAIQIYMDFSGYSDMAIGCAKCLGYDLRKNFNLPYISQNVSEFWKRWHISLSSWLQQYLYIPLGGNRKGTARTYLNLLITMLLGGLWHGANWTFVLWGGMHGAALCVHKLYRKLSGKGKKQAAGPCAAIIHILLTNLFVCFCWIFFRAENLSQAILVIRQICTLQDGIVHIYTWSIAAICILAAATICAAIRSRKQANTQINIASSGKNPGAISADMKKSPNVSGNRTGNIQGFYPILHLDRFLPLILFWTEIGLILGLAYVQGSPFIYFQF